MSVASQPKVDISGAKSQSLLAAVANPTSILIATV
jgi:hypothetical protein